MIRRTIHWPVLAGTIVAGMAICASLNVAHSWQLSKTSSLLLELARTEEDKSNPLKAAEYLDRYLRISPDDRAARVELAETYVKGANTPSRKRRATDLLYRALSVDIAEKEFSLREELAELLCEIRRFPEAEIEAEKILAANSESPAGSRLRALALIGQLENGALAAADPKELRLIGKLEHARQLNPSHLILAAALASVYRERAHFVRTELPDLSPTEREKRADECLDKFLSDHPQSADAWLTRARYRNQFHLPGGDEDLARALELEPGNPKVLRVAASSALVAAQSIDVKDEPARRDAFHKAQKLYATLIEKWAAHEVQPEAYLGHGDSLAGQSSVDAAIEVWGQALKAFRQPTVHATFHARIADLLLTHNRLTEAAEPLQSIDDILKLLGPDTPRDERLKLAQLQAFRRGAWHLKQGQPLEAIGQLRKVLDLRSKAEVKIEISRRTWLLMGEAYASLEEWHEAAVSFDEALALSTSQPNLAQINLVSANSWLNAGRAALASERAEQAIRLAPTAEAWFLLATAQFRLQTSLPQPERAWGRFQTALSALQKSAEAFAWPWQVDFLQADFLQTQAIENGKSNEEAQQAAYVVLRNAESKFSESSEFLSQLCRIYEQLNLPAEAERMVHQLQTLPGGELESKLAAAHLAIARADFDRAKKVLDQVDTHLPPNDASRLRSKRILVALGEQKPEIANRLLLDEWRANPRSLAVLRRLAELDLERMDLSALANRQRDFDAFGPLGRPFLHYYRACAALLGAPARPEPDLKTASAEQSQLLSLRPNWAETHTLRGMIEQRLGDVERAITAYELAIHLGETRISVFEQLIGLLDSKRRYTDAEGYLSKLGARASFSQRLTELGSAQQLRRNDPEHALKLAREGVSRRPDDPLARIWLGRLLMVCNYPAEAEEAFRQAVELAPHNVSSWNGLFSYYVRSKDKERARETLLKLGDTVNFEQPAERSFVLGQGFEFLGDVADAKRYYLDAAEKLPTNLTILMRLAAFYLRVDPLQAETVLRKAREIDRHSALARRMLAALLASRGNVDSSSELLVDSEEIVAATEDRRLNALLLVQYGGPEKIERAIELLESIIERDGGVPGDRLVLSQLYERLARSALDKSAAAAKLEQAKRQLLIVVARAAPEPGHLTFMVEYLLRRKDPGEAEHWLQKLEQIDADPLRPLTLRARLMKLAGQEAELRDLVEKRAEQILAFAKDDEERTRIFGRLGDLYFAVKDFPSSESWYRRHVTRVPERFDLLVAAVAPQPERLADAIAICEDAAQTSDTARPALALATCLLTNAAEAEYLDRADPLLSAAQRRFPKDIALQYAVSLVRLMQGRYDESVRGLRKILELRPKHVAAINNLALLLGERPAGRDEALVLIDKAFAIAGTTPGLLDTKGAIYLYQKNPDEAIKYLVPATQGETVDPRFNFHLAVAYYESKDSAKAREELDKALGNQLESQVLTQTDRLLLDDLRLRLLPKK